MIKVLLVEDNPGDALLTKKALAGGLEQYDISVVENAEIALEMLRKNTPYEKCHMPDFILLDLGLPKMSGHEFMSIIKADQKLKNIPVVVLSGVRNHIDAVYKESDGADFCLSKPSDQEGYAQLLQLIDRVWVPMMLRK